MSITWKQHLMKNGERDRNMELSTCGTYVIARYTYHPNRGACKPYWVGYLRSNGRCITPRDGLTYQHVKAAINQHHKTQSTN